MSYRSSHMKKLKAVKILLILPQMTASLLSSSYFNVAVQDHCLTESGFLVAGHHSDPPGDQRHIAGPFIPHCINRSSHRLQSC